MRWRTVSGPQALPADRSIERLPRRSMGAILTTSSRRLVPVILSGGAGTRLWPASRHDRPKQFLPLVNGRTTFSDTLARISEADLYAPPLIVTSRSFGFLAAAELEQAGLGGRIIMEPMRRDSGPAIAVAAVLAEQMQPAGLMLVLAADHVVRDAAAFNQAVRAGCEAAQAGRIVTFGIRPDSPSPNYGYIEPGPAIDAQVHELKRFIEKPDALRARTLIEQGCLWNSGNFLFRSDVLLAELAAFEPAMLAAAEAAVRAASSETVRGFSFDTLDEAAFAASPAKSIDYAVMERTSRAAVIPAGYGWSDLGSFEALWEILDKDGDDNVVAGDAAVQGTSGSYISSEGIFTAVVGLQNVAVVATADAVLVAPRGVAAEIKPIVANLERTQALRHLALRHQRSSQPWGAEARLLATDAVHLRWLQLNAGASLPCPVDATATTLLVVLAGEAVLTSPNASETLGPGACRQLLRAEMAQISNQGPALLEVLELQRRV